MTWVLILILHTPGVASWYGVNQSVSIPGYSSLESCDKALKLAKETAHEEVVINSGFCLAQW